LLLKPKSDQEGISWPEATPALNGAISDAVMLLERENAELRRENPPFVNFSQN
jgi:hypothetical protein